MFVSDWCHEFFDTSTVPEPLAFSQPPVNPALPARKSTSPPSRFRGPTVTNTLGTGSKRVYLDLQAQPPNVAYPPRPVPGSIADMDVVMDNCDFSEDKVQIQLK